MTTTPSLVRRKHGDGHTYKLDGEHAPGATSVLNAGFPKPALVGWAANCARDVVLNEWEHLLELEPSKRGEYVRTARDRDRDPLARRGTELHRLWEAHARGDEVAVPDELEGHFRAYERFVDEWQPRELLLEAVVAKRRPRYCGTLDVVADLADGRRWLLDWKTTRSGVYAENALQLAAYRFADFWIDSDGVEQPMPEVDCCGVVWIRADGYDLYQLEAREREFRVFQYVLEVARFADERFARDDYVPVVGPALAPPVPVKEAAA
jgi:hypothetical protein